MRSPVLYVALPGGSTARIGTFLPLTRADLKHFVRSNPLVWVTA